MSVEGRLRSLVRSAPTCPSCGGSGITGHRSDSRQMEEARERLAQIIWDAIQAAEQDVAVVAHATPPLERNVPQWRALFREARTTGVEGILAALAELLSDESPAIAALRVELERLGEAGDVGLQPTKSGPRADGIGRDADVDPDDSPEGSERGDR